jgi:hypothetical protein
MFKRLLLINVLLLGMLTFMTTEALAWTAGGGIWRTIESWARSNTEEVQQIDDLDHLPVHIQMVAGNVTLDGNPCDPYDVLGNFIGGCSMNITYYCVSKDCVDQNGHLIEKKKCLNQIASDPNSAHTEDDFYLYSDDSTSECEKKKNCKVTSTESYFDLDNLTVYADCPSGLRAVEVKPGGFDLYHRFCEGGEATAGEDDYSNCCRTDERDGDACVDIYGDYCSVRLVDDGNGNLICPDNSDGTSNYDPDDNIIRVLTQKCQGGDALVVGEPIPCTDDIYEPPLMEDPGPPSE